jgi:hypothetical protein
MLRKYFKKPYCGRLKDAFTKTRGQIYSEFSTQEKIIYMFLVFVGLAVIGWVWIFKLHMFGMAG